MKELKNLLTPFDVGHEKIRLGNESDGGYVLSLDVVEKSKRVYSLGIFDEFSIDVNLADMGKMVYQYDKNFCSVPKHQNMIFKQLFIDANTLREELKNTGGLSDCNNILLMDIEGGEYDVILNSGDLMDNFSLISIELHYVLSNQKTKSLLQKINETHTLIHIHANNWVLSKEHQHHIGMAGIRENVPDLLELTYVKNDTFTEKRVSNEKCPSKLDKKNSRDYDEVQMDWWVEQTR